MAEIHHGLAICAPAVSQHAALAALTGPQDCVEDARRLYDERRKLMCAALDKMGLSYARPERRVLRLRQRLVDRPQRVGLLHPAAGGGRR